MRKEIWQGIGGRGKKKGNKEEMRNEKGMETDILKWRSRYILPPLSSKTS